MEGVGQEVLGIDRVSVPLGPYPVDDVVGMRVACTMLVRSLDLGAQDRTVQFGTVRRFRSAFSNAFGASADTARQAVMAHETRRLFVTGCPTYSPWFDKFVVGLHKRMGDNPKKDKALSLRIVHVLMEQLEADWAMASSLKAKVGHSRFAMVLLLGFVLGLRGEEIMKMDGQFAREKLASGKENKEYPHVVVPLRGRFKGETGDRRHLMVMAWTTKSGLECGRWFERHLADLDVVGNSRMGYLFSDGKGRPQKASEYDEDFCDRLERARVAQPSLFDPGIDIRESYHVRRSLRRGSTTEALVRKIPAEVVEMNNRWRKHEMAKGRMASLSMLQHYTDVQLALGMLWEYSWSM